MLKIAATLLVERRRIKATSQGRPVGMPARNCRTCSGIK